MMCSLFYKKPRIRTDLFFLPVALLLIAVLLLTACGSKSETATTGASPKPPPTTVKGYGSANGCPSDAVVTGETTKATVMVKPGNANSTIVAHNGDIIEIRLPFGHKWSGPTNSQGTLELQGPAGYALKNDKVCVWRFVAVKTGVTKLGFHGQAICKPGQLCPMYIMEMPVTIDVK
jgi:hypothetical protein